MERTNFENLRVYRLSEKLQMKFGTLRLTGSTSRRTQLAGSWYAPPTASVPISPKEADAVAIWTTSALLELRAAP